MTKRTRRTFPENFKVEAVRLAQAGNGNIAAVARDLDVHVTTLRDWIQKADAPAPDSAPLSPSEKQELLQLRRDVAVLRMEREILKKAATFFAKESR
jgi:transposase